MCPASVLANGCAVSSLLVRIKRTLTSVLILITAVPHRPLRMQCPMKCDLSSGAVVTIRPGAFKAAEGPTPVGVVMDKSAEVGALTAGRRYLETIAAESTIHILPYNRARKGIS